MDEKDKLILFELLQDCRQPLVKIAKVVKLPQQTVNYRIKKLENEGIIKKYTINLNYAKLGYSRHSLYLDLKGIDSAEVDHYLKLITDIKEVSCCYMLRDVSEWKLYVSIWTKTIERYDEIQTKIITKFKKHLNNYVSFQSVKSYTYFARLLNSNKKAKVDIKASPESFQIKEIDWKILDKLKQDSRMPILQIAKEVKSTINTVISRIKFLAKNDIIQRFYPIINLKKVGLTEYTFISRLDPSHGKDLEKFIEYAKSDSRFVIIIKAVGYVNLYYSFLVRDDKELKEVTKKIESLIGKATLKTYKIEVEEMIN